MAPKHEGYPEILRELGRSFDRQVIESPGFLGDLPQHAYVTYQIVLDGSVPPDFEAEVERLNEWMIELATSQRDRGQQIFVAVCHLRPLFIQAAERLTPQVISDSCGAYDLVPVPV